MTRLLSLFLAALSVLALPSVLPAQTSWPQTVSGEVLYRERIAPPPGARLLTALQEETGEGRRTVAESVVSLDGRAMPWPFTLEVSKPKVASSPRAFYLTAFILGPDNEVFASSERVPVTLPLTAPLRILVRVGGGDGSFMGTITAPAHYEGHQKHADAVCAAILQLNADHTFVLERSQTRNKKNRTTTEAGRWQQTRAGHVLTLGSGEGVTRVPVRQDGRLELPDAAHPDAPLILEAFPEGVGKTLKTPSDLPAALQEPGQIANRYWRLLEMDGLPAAAYANQPEPHLVVREENGGYLLGGSDGCNSILGAVELTRTAFRARDLGGTMMLCAAGGEQAQKFMERLAQADAWRAYGNVLELMREGRPTLVFESVPMK